jgi:hypothetical protein
MSQHQTRPLKITKLLFALTVSLLLWLLLLLAYSLISGRWTLHLIHRSRTGGVAQVSQRDGWPGSARGAIEVL